MTVIHSLDMQVPVSVSMDDPFLAQAQTIMAELSAAAANLVRAANAGSRATDFTENLGLDKSIAWHLAELAHPERPLLAAAHVPGADGVAIIASAAERRGCDAQAIHRFTRAVDAFRNFQRDFAGDKTALQAMMTGLAGVSDDLSAGEPARKAAFRANASVFGIQARAQLQIDFTAPSRDSDALDFATVRSFVGLARWRHDAAWMISRTRAHVNGQRVESVGPQPIDRSAFDAAGAPILAEFTSRPLPTFRESPDPRGSVNRYYSTGSIGLSGAIDLTLGEYARGVGSCYAQTEGEPGEVFARLYTPAGLFLHDWLVHKSLLDGPWQGRLPEWRVYSELGSGMLYPNGEQDKPRLPNPTRPTEMGNVLSLPAIREAPRYREILHYVSERMGWNAAEFYAFRAKIKYPPIPATSTQLILLPTGPT